MTATDTNAIFTPIKVGNNVLKHRVVLALVTRFRATDQAVPTDLQVQYYKQCASEGDLLIAEATLIDCLTGGAPGIYNKEQIENWKKVTHAVHSKSSDNAIVCQLWYVGRAGAKYFNPNGEHIVSSSAIPITGKNLMTGDDYEVPHALEIDEIKTIIG
jgi:2,4-dienoyl-CoA reductase-like NADH-dependent reductase (Old Yellow Enzyme family)